LGFNLIDFQSIRNFGNSLSVSGAEGRADWGQAVDRLFLKGIARQFRGVDSRRIRRRDDKKEFSCGFR
jgi:hypothetical protein